MTSGPEPLGRWSSSSGSSLEFPEMGTRYRVIREFTDNDNQVHPVGEEWTFLGSSFVPYHSGMCFLISFDDQQEWMLPLQGLPEAQGHVLSKLKDYLAPIGTSAVGLRIREEVYRAVAAEKRASAPRDFKYSKFSDELLKRAMPWLFIALGPIIVMALYYELSRELNVPATGALEWVAFGVSIFAGAFVLWLQTRPKSTRWLVLYVPSAAIAIISWIAEMQ